jgi:hypothetical protein
MRDTENAAAVLRSTIAGLEAQIASLNEDIVSVAPHDREAVATLRRVLDFRQDYRCRLEWHLAELLKAS